MADTKITGYLNGFIACHGDENLVFDYTEPTGSPLTIKRSAANVFEIDNDGTLNLTSTATKAALEINVGEVVHTPATQTSSFDAHTLTLTSGGVLGVDELVGQFIDVQGHATDTGYIYGQAIEFTPNAGSALSFGTYINSDWYFGILSEATVAVINNTTAPLPTGTLLVLSTDNTDPLSDYFVQFNDANAGVQRFGINQLGVGEWDANDTNTALTIGQSGAGDILALKDGTVLAGTNRFVITDDGLATFSPADDYQAVDINCVVTNTTATDYAAFTIDVTHAADLSQDGKDVYGAKATVYSRVGDNATVATQHAGYRAEFSGTLPTDTDVNMYGFSAGSGFLSGLYSESPLFVQVATRPTNLPVPAIIAFTGVASGMPTLYVPNGANVFAPDTEMQFTDYGQLIVICDYDDKPTLKLKQLHATGHYIDVWDETDTLVFNLLDKGAINMWSATDIGRELMSINQQDDDEAFIDFVGDQQADYSGNISTLQGDGAVVGPQAKSMNHGWTFEKMVKMEVNGTVYWMAVYGEDPVV